MSDYVIGDIHGCYDELQAMIEKIGLSNDDRLFMVGDYIDRGDQNVEMLQWLEDHPDNILPVKGNHDANFAYYVSLMKQISVNNDLNIRSDFYVDALKLYLITRETLASVDSLAAKYFDMYGTIQRILTEDKVTLSDLERWASMLDSLPLYREVEVGVKRCIVVHAGFREDLADDEERERFFLESRKPAYTQGGIPNGIVIAGHTPTFIEGEFTYNGGDVFRYYDATKNCVFYDIDCGCVFRKEIPKAKLACIRLEDEKVIYL